MKLIIITAVKEFESDVKKLFKKAQIPIFSFKDINGYRDISEESIESNWFGGDYNEVKSIMFYSFAEETKADVLYTEIDEFNQHLKSKSKIHIAILNIEKTN